MQERVRDADAAQRDGDEMGDLPGAGRRSDLQPTRMTGIADPQIERTSSIHCSCASRMRRGLM